MVKLKLIKRVTYEELIKMYKNEKDKETKERLLTIKLYYEGHKDHEISKTLNRDPLNKKMKKEVKR